LAVGTPVLIGPHTFNFADATRLAVSEGAAQRVPDAVELVKVAQQLLQDDAVLIEMKARGQDFVATHQGATDKAMALIVQNLATA